MKDNRYFRNIALTVVLTIALGACLFVRAFLPMGVLPKLDIPNVVLLSMLALLADHYFVPGTKRCGILNAVFAAASFGLLPWVCGFATGAEAVKLGIVGGIAFLLSACLFASMQDRLSTGPAAKAAPVLSALGLYLAAQCFSGILL